MFSLILCGGFICLCICKRVLKKSDMFMSEELMVKFNYAQLIVGFCAIICFIINV